ncbi:GTPase-activating protein CdGAPr isoform X2 [Adelges cooleyi]|nr:GTPase-activating protein CdGAPr isoform X2 [Adelges cooleyi]
MTEHFGLNRNSEARSSGSSIISSGSTRVSTIPVTSIEDGKSRFPKLEECAHFHYEYVELGPLKLELIEEDEQKFANIDNDCWFTIKVESQNTVWVLRRSYENSKTLDHQLHKCVYDRKFSLLPELLAIPCDCENPNEFVKNLISKYCSRLSQIAVGSLINCGPILSWLELDNRGHHLLVADGDHCAINTPAVAAAYSVRKYTANASDELSFEIGDIISVIDMPSPEESIWWRGKHGFLVGFFPSNYVVVITDKVPRNLYINPQMQMALSEPTKPVLRKHGKLISFFRSFILSRPTRRTLKQSGILKERVFGCDLGEHLLNSGRDLPDVLTSCAEFIEKFGIVDGIYRLSGVTSNIQRLRSTFDEDKVPELWDDESIRQDIHSVASLLKLYFRELPNPLCTYQLYDSFVNAVQSVPEKTTEDKLRLMRETVQKLPPPHFRTLEYLMKHLSRVAALGEQTGMTARNVAIVWAPNLLRSKQLETGSGVAALHGVGIQAVVTEFLIRYTEYIFSLTCNVGAGLPPKQGTPKRSRPKSLAISTHTKLLTLEEAQNRVKKSDTNYIEVGGGPSCLPEKYHTVIDLPSKRCTTSKRRSPLRWKSFFTRGGSSVSLGAVPFRKKSEPNLTPFKTMKSKDRMCKTMVGDLDVQDSPKSFKLSGETMSLKEIKGMSPCSPPRLCGPVTLGHNRSVSHDSYFDQLADQEDLDVSPVPRPSQEELSDLQVNFDLDESDMRVFSDEDTTHIFSNRSSMDNIQIFNSNTLNNSSKRLPILAPTEDSLSADPSPKKKKITDSNKSDSKKNRLSYLEERFASPDIRFIDSQSPEHMTVLVDVHNSCDEIMADIESNEIDNGSVSTITTPTISYHPLSEDSCSERNLTPSFCNFESSEQLTKNLLNTPRNRLSYQGDLHNKRLSTDRRSFQEIKYGNSLDYKASKDGQHESRIKKDIDDLFKSNNSMVVESSKNLDKPLYEIIMGNNYERLGDNNSIFNQDDLSSEEKIPLNKQFSSVNSIENLNFEQEKTVENIHYETLVTTSPESCNSSHHEMSISPEEPKEFDKSQHNDNSKVMHEQMVSNNNFDAISPSYEDTEMLIQDTPRTLEQSDAVNKELNEMYIIEGFSGGGGIADNNTDITCLESSRRKFECEIGRNIVHDRRMRKELMENSSTTGNKENLTNVKELLNKFDTNKSNKSCPTWMKNRRLRNNCQNINATVSLDAFNFPLDVQNLERVRTSPNLISLESGCQKSDSSCDMEATRRERIERYKEERRLALRERFKAAESTSYDDEDIKRLRAKSLKSPEESSDNKFSKSFNTQQKRLGRFISCYDEREKLTSNVELADWHTRSLERKKNYREETIGLVASRVNQLIGSTKSSDNNDNQNSLKTVVEKPLFSSVRQRAHSASGISTQFCIKDMAALFEQKH